MAGNIISKGSGLVDSLFGKSEAPIKAIIEHEIEDFEQDSQFKKIFCMDTTDKYGERYLSMTSSGNFEDVGENGAYPDTSFQEGFSKFLEPSTWKNRLTITREMMEDGNQNMVIAAARDFGLSYARTREQYAAATLIGGLNSSMKFGNKDMQMRTYDTTTGDKLSLFNKAHKSITQPKYTQSNRFSYTSSDDLYTVLDTMQEKMQKFTDDDGNLLATAPDTIIIPNSGKMKRKLTEVVGSEFKDGGNRVGFNFQYGGWNFIIWNYLPNTIAGKEYFMLMDSKKNQNTLAMPFLDRVKLTTDSYTDKNTDAQVYTGRARFIAGFVNWRSIAIAGEDLADATALL